VKLHHGKRNFAGDRYLVCVLKDGFEPAKEVLGNCNDGYYLS
jgi:hypothetical protein